MALTTSQAEWQLKAACRGPQAAVFFPPTTPERRDEKRRVAGCIGGVDLDDVAAGRR